MERPQPAWNPARERYEKRPSFQVSQAARAAATMQQLIDDLSEEIALLDERATILTVNTAWKRTVEAQGHFLALPGDNYRDVCARRAAEGYAPAADALVGLDDILSGKSKSWDLVYNGGELWSGRDYHICINRITAAGQPIISVTRYDVTELVELRRLKEGFADTLIEGQSVERKRMARELHDSTSQMLTAIGLLLGRFRDGRENTQSTALVDEMQGLVSEAHREIRAISYLAHPPALDDLGLVAATKALVEGLGRRANLEIAFELQGQAIVLPPHVEGAFYRIAQEALSNVHRHAHAKWIRVFLSFRDSVVHLIIADDGVGISRETLAGAGRAGVGLASMRSRMREVGGRLSVRRLSPGTAIVASYAARI
jgi:two-component system NarL family sensor kinase